MNELQIVWLNTDADRVIKRDVDVATQQEVAEVKMSET